MAATLDKAKLLKVDPRGSNDELIDLAGTILKAGGVVIYPTETFYALGAVPWAKGAVDRIFRLKGRDAGKPLPLIASDLESVLETASEWPEAAGTLAGLFWPGPLSFLISAVAGLAEALHAQDGKIVVRVSSHGISSALAKACGGLIISTSANRAGGQAWVNVETAGLELSGLVDAVIDAGKLPGGLPSTIVDVARQPVSLIRAGRIAWDDVRRALGPESKT